MTQQDPRQRAKAAVRRFIEKFEPKHIRVRAIMGDGAGNLTTSEARYYLARLLGRTPMLVKAYCETLVPAHGMHVILEVTDHAGQRRYVVVGRPDDQGWFDTERGYGQGSLAPPHHWAHEENGPDAINVSSYMLENVRATLADPEGLKVHVAYGYVAVGTETKWFAGADTDEFDLPPYGEQWVLVSLDSNLDFNYTYGEIAWTNAVKPDLPTEELPICYVLLRAGDSAVDSQRLYDARPSFTLGVPFVPGESDVTTEKLHLHVIQEDKSEECDGVKAVFIPANEFEPNTLNVFLNGLLKREGAGKDFTEGVFRDVFEMAVPPAAVDTLTVEYLAVH